MTKARFASLLLIASGLIGCWTAADAGEDGGAAPGQGGAKGSDTASATLGGADAGDAASATWSGPSVSLSLVPTKHRVESTACPQERAPGSANVVGECTQDSDCTNGLNGRCISPNVLGPLGESSCSYDNCGSDSDCAAKEPCRCRESADSAAANVCLVGSNCQVDSDCGPGGFCSPSRFDINSSVGAIGVLGDGMILSGYFCHTSQDYCVNNSDCDTIECVSEQGCASVDCAYSTEERWDCFKVYHH